MADYPTPEGWKGGPPGSIQRQGSAGRIGMNSSTDLGERIARLDRDNDLDCEHADFGGEHAGQKYCLDQTHDDWDEFDPGQGNTTRY